MTPKYSGSARIRPLTPRQLAAVHARCNAELHAAVRWRGLRWANARSHILRFTFCSHLVLRGVHVRTIQKLADHANLSTTELYMHLVSEVTTRSSTTFLEHMWNATYDTTKILTKSTT